MRSGPENQIFDSRISPAFIQDPGASVAEDGTAFKEDQEGADADACLKDPLSAFSRGVTYRNYISGGILWKS
jgi:hypothetical protein